MRYAAAILFAGLLAALPAAPVTLGAGDAAGPLGRPEGPFRRQTWLIPLPGQSLLMHTLVLRPPGAGPFPLAVINHGSAQNVLRRQQAAMPEYPAASGWFLERGYAVALPLRPGHGATGGPYLEDHGRCENPDYVAAGRATADSIAAAVAYLMAEPFVRKAGTVVVGESAGGWGALALAGRNLPLRAVVNFSGGRGGRAGGVANHVCAPERLVEAAATFGRTARIPSLWLYAENDSFFPPTLSRRMYEAYRAAGGRAAYHLIAADSAEGHLLMVRPQALPRWKGIVADFLAAQ